MYFQQHMESDYTQKGWWPHVFTPFNFQSTMQNCTSESKEMTAPSSFSQRSSPSTARGRCKHLPKSLRGDFMEGQPNKKKTTCFLSLGFRTKSNKGQIDHASIFTCKKGGAKFAKFKINTLNHDNKKHFSWENLQTSHWTGATEEPLGASGLKGGSSALSSESSISPNHFLKSSKSCCVSGSSSSSRPSKESCLPMFFTATWAM